MEARIVRENLSTCQKVEGVNHYERCRHLAERYADMLKENRVRVSFSFACIDFWFQFVSVSRECMLTVSGCQLQVKGYKAVDV